MRNPFVLSLDQIELLGVKLLPIVLALFVFTLLQFWLLWFIRWGFHPDTRKIFKDGAVAMVTMVHEYPVATSFFFAGFVLGLLAGGLLF